MGAKLKCENTWTVTNKDSVSSFSLILLNQKYAYLQNVDTFLYGFRKYSTIYVDLFSHVFFQIFKMHYSPCAHHNQMVGAHTCDKGFKKEDMTLKKKHFS